MNITTCICIHVINSSPADRFWEAYTILNFLQSDGLDVLESDDALAPDSSV